MIERENTPMTTSSDVIAGLELALASADAMIERLQGERAILRDSAKDVIAWCDANPPVGDALYCITRLRHAIAATESPNAGSEPTERLFAKLRSTDGLGGS